MTNNTENYIKNLNKVINGLKEKDKTINEWRSIKSGCDSPHNMKNHIDKLNRDLEEWKSIIPNCHTPKLAAIKITRLKTELEDWQAAVPNCETPTKLKAWFKQYQSEEEKQESIKNNDNFKIYLNFIEGVNDLSISASKITIQMFNEAKINILKYIDDPETPDERIQIIDTYKIIDFLIYEFENQIQDPQVPFDKLTDIKRRF